MFDNINGADEDWKRICTAALSVWDQRLTDASTREHVLFLHLVDGDRHLRAHDGVCYFYNKGAWNAFTGVMPEAVLRRVKIFMLRLEGLSRSAPQSMASTQNDTCELLVQTLNDHPSDWRSHLEWAAVKYVQVNRRGGSSNTLNPDDESQLPGAVPVAVPAATGVWVKDLANNISRCALCLLRELLNKTVLTHYIEWCETPSPRTPGIVFADSCFLFDHDGAAMKSCKPSPALNIYVHLPLPLHDPVLLAAKERLQKFWMSTYWENGRALQCSLAAQGLALRGRNVDRAFWSVGPGGVGQSLEAHRIAA